MFTAEELENVFSKNKIKTMQITKMVLFCMFPSLCLYLSFSPPSLSLPLITHTLILTHILLTVSKGCQLLARSSTACSHCLGAFTKVEQGLGKLIQGPGATEGSCYYTFT